MVIHFCPTNEADEYTGENKEKVEVHESCRDSTHYLYGSVNRINC